MRGVRSGSRTIIDGQVFYRTGSIAQGKGGVGDKPHLHLRERARRLHAPGPERAAFIARGGKPLAKPRARRTSKA